MNFIIKRKWFVLIAWIVVVAGLFLAAPNMADLVREKGQITVPDEYSSSIAGEILSDAQSQKGGGNETQVALVFHDEKKLTEDEIKEAERAIRLLEDKKGEIGITEILTHFNEDTLKEQLVSEDGKSILASVTVSWNDREPKEVSEALYQAIEDVKVDHYYTSEWLITEDLMTSAQEGLKKTEGITVVFILVVLLLVFRSLIAPIIPLVTVGFAYLASQSIVAMLVDQFDFPISTYTQIFLVAVLFGIGTDYCILLLSRFKEELSHRESLTEAIIETYKNAGRTVLFSGIAVMIGFAAIGFSQFILYQSAVAVAVGVALLLGALFTVVPFFMAVLGRKLFWPSKKNLEHGDSKIWEIAGRFSLGRPLLSLLVVAAIVAPFLFVYDGDISYDSLEELSGDVNSIKAFNAIAGSFGPGESMPTQIVLKNDEAMDSTEYIELAEKISQEVEKVDLVDTVRSVTRPTGEPIEDLFVANQAKTLEEGLGEGKDGLTQIKDGLEEAGSELAKSEPELKTATDGIGELITGTNQVKSGLTEIQTNLSKIESGIRSGTAGIDTMIAEVGKAKAGAEELGTYYNNLSAGYKDAQGGIATLLEQYSGVALQLDQLSTQLNQFNEQGFEEFQKRHQGVAEDPFYGGMKKSILTLQQGIPAISGGIKTLNGHLSGANDGLIEANAGFEQLLKEQTALPTGFEQLIAGLEQLKGGLLQAANGQGQIVQGMPQITNGLTGINDGQKQLLAGFGSLGGQITQLTDGLTQSAEGLGQVSDGLGSAQEYLSDLSNSEDLNAFYMPEEVLESDDFAQVLDVYMSKDRKIMTFDVIFEANPYSNEAMDQIDEINAAVERATKGTKLENADVALGGITSTNTDLSKMSEQDYSRTIVLMFIGIALILIFLFRSLIMPIYIIGSLILTYYTSMAINEVIFVNILGYTGISWAVPFFGFVILVALGVDYSIFLMDRFNEFRDISVAEAMLLSMKKMGTVIISAAIILGGTFAAMMPSGMLSLLQIASITLVGLLLYAFVILPLFIPVMVKNFGIANWWPFKRPTN
ncbi:MMPL family transporter [Fredinandcohnia sp. QZ13]|uniref:MMPL family transporter n=1 Tax=Fredinandcohnia sp. QZ13 TaxID=3073144 RepID=UPI0028532C92|nr:MMPL family transporter [Fredinandcohnia sp. QZ13]MDR4889508.1 MMPL family transporter [Fredinandcohnia sp. QZ13]